MNRGDHSFQLISVEVEARIIKKKPALMSVISLESYRSTSPTFRRIESTVHMMVPL